jgi:hypothetical protein
VQVQKFRVQQVIKLVKILSRQNSCTGEEQVAGESVGKRVSDTLLGGGQGDRHGAGQGGVGQSGQESL